MIDTRTTLYRCRECNEIMEEIGRRQKGFRQYRCRQCDSYMSVEE